jgi:hypothetical protein
MIELFLPYEIILPASKLPTISPKIELVHTIVAKSLTLSSSSFHPSWYFMASIQPLDILIANPKWDSLSIWMRVSLIRYILFGVSFERSVDSVCSYPSFEMLSISKVEGRGEPMLPVGEWLPGP